MLELGHIFCGGHKSPTVIPRYTESSRLHRLLGTVTVHRLSLLFTSLTALRIPGQVFCRLSLNLSLSDVFLLVRPGLWALERKTAEVSVVLNAAYQGHLLSPGFVLMMLTMITWPRKCLPGFSTAKSLSYAPISIPYSLEEVTKHGPHLRDKRLCSTP